MVMKNTGFKFRDSESRRISIFAMVFALFLPLMADTVDLASIEGDILEITSIAAGTDYTNSSEAPKTLLLNISQDTTYPGSISGKIKLQASMGSNATLTLSGNNSFTEGLDILSGTLNVTCPEAFGTGPVALANAKAYLKFSKSMTVPNQITLNDYSKANWSATLTVDSGYNVELAGPVKSDMSWVASKGNGSLTFSGGIEILTDELFCGANGVISFTKTPFTVSDGHILKVVGTRTFSYDRRVEIGVAGNDVSKIGFVDRGCLRLAANGAFTSKPDLHMLHDNRAINRNGGGVDLNGFSQAFGSITFAHGNMQNSFLICNSSATPATFSFEQTVNETAAFIETSGAIDLVKFGDKALTVTNAGFSVSGCLDIREGTLKFTGVDDGARLAKSIRIRTGAILDLGGNTVSCVDFINMGGVVTNGTLTAETKRLVASADSEVSFGDKDLAVYYPLDREDRLCTDFSFHGNADLLSRGSPECVTDAKFGKALYLDGSSALTNSVFPSTLPVKNEAWSTCLYLKFDNTENIVGKYHPVGWGACSMSAANFLQLMTVSKFDHIIWSDTPLTGTLPNGNFADGWHSMVVTYCPTNNVRSMYFDGTLVASGAVNRDGASRTPNVAAANFALGGKQNNEYDWKGWLDEVAVFRRALTAEEVTRYHASGVEGIAAKTIGTGVYEEMRVEENATLRIAQKISIETLAGPGTVETWGMTITDNISGSPSAIGDVTLADDVEFTVSELPKDEPLILLDVTGGDLILEGGVRLTVNGVDKTENCNFYVRNNTLYARYRQGLMLLVK